MKQHNIEGIDNAEQLEQLYRQHPQVKVGDVVELLAIAAFTAILVLLPVIFTGIGYEFFYLRDFALITFTGLILYSLRINGSQDLGPILLILAGLIILGIYMNLLPAGTGDSVATAILHAPLLLWFLFGISYLRFNYRQLNGWLDFVRFSGELIIMTGLILLAGGVLTLITMVLFQVIDIEIMPLYLHAIALPGAAAAPVIAWYLIRTYPGITSNIAPVIARVFTPVVLLTLTVFLISLAFAKSNILANRELLIVFNLMLLGVMALIVFSFSGINREKPGKNTLRLSFLLSILAIVINFIALMAIVSRVFEGLTPNRTVVMMTNILIFINLIMITPKLYRASFRGGPTESIEKTVAGYLPVYAIWSLLAIFMLPAIFGFR